jgi:hypothetical protein
MNLPLQNGSTTLQINTVNNFNQNNTNINSSINLINNNLSTNGLQLFPNTNQQQQIQESVTTNTATLFRN